MGFADFWKKRHEALGKASRNWDLPPVLADVDPDRLASLLKSDAPTPTVIGSKGVAWQMPDEKTDESDIAVYIVLLPDDNAPLQLAMCMHLRPTKVLPKPSKIWASATHEIMLAPLAPTMYPLDIPRIGTFDVMGPAGFVEQFANLTDQDMKNLIAYVVSHLCAGTLPPEWRAAYAWKYLIDRHIDACKAGEMGPRWQDSAIRIDFRRPDAQEV